MKRQLMTYKDAVLAKGQHKKPCSDCPFARTALPGWLGDKTIEEWIAMVHGETWIDCHTLLGAQCAGAAIYRTNNCKNPRDKALLLLPRNPKVVFANPQEFMKHHSQHKDVSANLAVTQAHEGHAVRRSR